MGSDIPDFIRSLTAASALRVALTVALTTLSVRLAYGDSSTPTLLIACNLITVAGALFMEYKNFKARD